MNTESNLVAGQPLPAVAAPPAGGTLSDPERWVELYGDYLFKCALMRVRDAATAEDQGPCVAFCKRLKRKVLIDTDGRRGGNDLGSPDVEIIPATR